MRLRVLREDVEDDRAPIDDPEIEALLEVLLLRRPQLVIRDEEVDAQAALLARELVDLALPHVARRIGARAALDDGAGDLRARGPYEGGELRERPLHVERALLPIVHGDEERAFRLELGLDHRRSASRAAS